MNRRERRAATKTGNVAFADFGVLLEGNPNYGLQVSCYVCGSPHAARGVARLQGAAGSMNVALCDGCNPRGPGGFDADKEKAVLRKYLNAPDLEIKEGGEQVTEIISALAEKDNATEH